MKKNRAPQLPVGRRWHFDNSRSAHWSERPRTVAFLAGLLVLLFAQAGGRAAVGVDALPFSKGFLVTGNYVVGGVDLTPQANPAVQMATPPGRSRSAARPPAVRTSSRRISTSRRSIRLTSPPTPQIQGSASSSEVRRSVRPSAPSRNSFRAAAAQHVGDQRARALSQYRCTARTCSRSCPNSSTRKASGLESTSSTAQSFPRTPSTR